ncbi:hypothetical protein B0H13DRAFT_374082 [Mycena leptocephala]|nr:hypothetical protein B0H13DRAFT_374082 [Mycena leptocephala]
MRSTTSVPRAVRAPTALRTRRERSIAAPRATSHIRGWAPPGLYDNGGECAPRAPPRLPRPLRLQVRLRPSSSRLRATSAWKRAVRKRKEGERGKIAVLLGRHSASAQRPLRTRTRTRARWCLEDRRCATSGVNEGVEHVHPRGRPARRGYEVRELEHGYRRDVEVHLRSRSASSTRTRLPSPDSTRARLPTTRLRICGSGRRVGGRSRRRRVRSGTDGRRWRERAGAGAGQGQATAGRARREGGGEGKSQGAGTGVLEKVRCRSFSVPLLLSKRRQGKRCMRGKGRGQQHTDEGGCCSRKARESALRVPVVSLAARLGGVAELEPPLGPFWSSCWSHALTPTCHLGLFFLHGNSSRLCLREWCDVSIMRHSGVCGLHEARAPPWLRRSCRLSLSLWCARVRRAGMRVRYPWNFSHARLGV